MNKFHLIQYSTNDLLDVEYLKISKQLCEKYSELYGYNYKFIITKPMENIKICWFKKLDICIEGKRIIEDGRKVVKEHFDYQNQLKKMFDTVGI